MPSRLLQPMRRSPATRAGLEVRRGPPAVIRVNSGGHDYIAQRDIVGKRARHTHEQQQVR